MDHTDFVKNQSNFRDISSEVAALLVGAGMPLAITDAAKRHDRAIADPGEPTPTLSTYPGANLDSTPPKRLDEIQFAPDQSRPSHSNVLDQ